MIYDKCIPVPWNLEYKALDIMFSIYCQPCLLRCSPFLGPNQVSYVPHRWFLFVWMINKNIYYHNHKISQNINLSQDRFSSKKYMLTFIFTSLKFCSFGVSDSKNIEVWIMWKLFRSITEIKTPNLVSYVSFLIVVRIIARKSIEIASVTTFLLHSYKL